MNVTFVLNRGFEFRSAGSDVIHLCPFGDFPGSCDGKRVVQRLNKSVANALASDFKNKAKNPMFPGVVVDFDHNSENPEKSSIAAGWIDDLFVDGDGLKAKVRWSDVGKEAIKNGRYRMLSPAWSGIETPDKSIFIPTELCSVALTNSPNIKGAKPITNSIMNRSNDEAAAQKILNRALELQSKGMNRDMAFAMANRNEFSMAQDSIAEIDRALGSKDLMTVAEKSIGETDIAMERGVAQKIGERAKELQAKGMSYNTAFATATQEVHGHFASGH